MSCLLYVVDRAYVRDCDLKETIENHVWQSVVEDHVDANILYELGYDTNSVLQIEQNPDRKTLIEAAVENGSTWSITRLLDFQAPKDLESLQSLARSNLRGEKFAHTMAALQTETHTWTMVKDSDGYQVERKTSFNTKTMIDFSANTITHFIDAPNHPLSRCDVISLSRTQHRRMVEEARKAIHAQAKQPRQVPLNLAP